VSEFEQTIIDYLNAFVWGTFIGIVIAGIALYLMHRWNKW